MFISGPVVSWQGDLWSLYLVMW